MISRHWKGVARRETAADYIHYLRTETFPRLSRLPGFRRATIFHRTVPDGVEFVIVTDWDSLDAIRTFAGPDVERAVVPSEVQAMMQRYEDAVTHYDIAETFEPARPPYVLSSATTYGAVYPGPKGSSSTR
jgi:heme-degrading monooxygenase HmoA